MATRRLCSTARIAWEVAPTSCAALPTRTCPSANGAATETRACASLDVKMAKSLSGRYASAAIFRTRRRVARQRVPQPLMDSASGLAPRRHALPTAQATIQTTSSRQILAPAASSRASLAPSTSVASSQHRHRSPIAIGSRKRLLPCSRMQQSARIAALQGESSWLHKSPILTVALVVPGRTVAKLSRC